MRAGLLAAAIIAFGANETSPAGEPETATSGPESPLIEYALEQHDATHRYATQAIRNLKAALFELQRHPPPPAAECAQTLGASRFAQQYERLASVRHALGEFEEAIEANEAALACTPRDASLYAAIAALHLTLGRLTDSRAALEKGLAIEPENNAVVAIRARLDFLEERWADATARFRLAMIEESGGELAGYYECFFWLSQRRAGVREPERGLREEEKQEWVSAILETLTGAKTEKQLAADLRQRVGTASPREYLTEALYYVGELRLAEGDVQRARRHFAAVVNLKVTNYVEYGMARAELAKLKEQSER
jgi:lipoprotein NlpI